MKVGDILRKKTARISTIRMNETVAIAAQLMRAGNVSALVVKDVVRTEGNTAVGMFTERDVVRAFAKDGARLADMHVRDLMTREVTTCTQETSMVEAEKLMNKLRVRHLPVMDGGRLVGMLSIRDVMVWRQQEARDEVNVLRDVMIAVRNR